jgi:tetratricopeptide (TPR) repeat protein
LVAFAVLKGYSQRGAFKQNTQFRRGGLSMKRFGFAACFFLPLALGIAPVCFADEAAKSAARPVLFLDRGLESAIRINGGIEHSQLCRELIRQAILLAAREELGWRAEDAWLGDHIGAGSQTVPLDVVGVPGPRNEIDILRGPYPQQRRIASVELPSDIDDEASLLAACETLSRTKFPEILKTAAGLKAVSRPAFGSAPLPADVATKIDELTFFAQFDAVRSIHSQIADRGESPALWGGLIRAYSNLVLMTDGLWNPSFRVYAARALLYAQRWHMHDPRSPMALWHRAYAEALCGLHAMAIDDLEAADKFQDAEPANERVEPPTWVPLIRAFVFFDFKQFRKVAAEKADPQLSPLLSMIMYEETSVVNAAIEVGLKALPYMPDCYRVHDELMKLGGVALGHRTTPLASQVLASRLYYKLAEIHELPGEAAAIVEPRAGSSDTLDDKESTEEEKVRVKLIAALYGAAATRNNFDDAAEPSFAALASWIEDTTFQQVYRRIEFVAELYGVDADDEINAFVPLFEHHRFKAAINWFRSGQADKDAALKEMFDIPLHGVDLRARGIYQPLIYNYDAVRGRQATNTMRSSMDNTVHDCQMLCGSDVFLINDEVIESLAHVSPHDPLPIALMIEQHWAWFRDHADQYEQLAHKYACVALAVGGAYQANKQFAKAEEFYKVTVKLDPARYSYGRLSKLYLSQGNLEQFRQTAEDCLKKTPDFALDHATVNNYVALVFMRRGKFEEAKPFAEAGGESYANWALTTLALEYEELGDFEKANDVYKARAGRYGSRNLWPWYYFCLRTGQGEREMARSQTVQKLKPISAGKEQYHSITLAMIDQMEGNDSEAATIHEWLFDHESDPVPGLLAALLFDKLGDSARRDKLLAEMRPRIQRYVRTDDPDSQCYVRVARLLIDDLQKGGHADFSIADAEAICKSGGSAEPNASAYVIGAYLAKRGKMDDAKRFWLRATDELQPEWVWFNLASWQLKNAGVMPNDQPALRKKLGITDRWFQDD